MEFQAGAEASADQERPVEEQTIPLQPKSTVRAGSPREAAEEPTGQQWMRPEDHSPWIPPQ